MGQFEDISTENHQQIFDVNVIGTINTCHAAFPFLMKSKAAIVVNLSSASSLYGIPELASYSASKFAIKGLTEALELEWSKYDISVCDIAPPFINTNMMSSQSNGAKVLDSMGINFEASDVAKVVAKQIKRKRLHRTVGIRYTILYMLNELTPSIFTRLYIKFLAR